MQVTDWTLEHWWEQGSTELTQYQLTDQKFALTERGSAEPSSDQYFSLELPIRLEPIHIPKPWGEEIWYTGVEERGQALVRQKGSAIPLPWLLSACPEFPEELVLLKILAPLAEPVFGDLYFELHEEKQEVYVITSIDQNAWPSGTGAIRMGFDAQQARESGFRERFSAAVARYQEIRNQIDALIDEQRTASGVGLNEPVSADIARAWLKTVPEALQIEEERRRAHLDSYTQLIPLNVGDVVKVPTHCPHSLQHGVRAVEFQTPVYERLIVAFAQKVLTQAGWDTERAVELMQLETPEQPAHEVLRSGDDYRDERIVDFNDFTVRRFTLEPGAVLDIKAPEAYAQCMVVAGQLVLNGIELCAEQAVLISKVWAAEPLRNTGNAPLIVLWAEPADQRP